VIILTALIGFFFGIANTQAADFIERADECSDALNDYGLGVSEFVPLRHAYHNQGQYSNIESTPILRFSTVIGVPFNRVNNKCPVHSRKEYLSVNDAEVWKETYPQLLRCRDDTKC